MRLCNFRAAHVAASAVIVNDKVVPLDVVNRVLEQSFPTSVSALIRSEQLATFRTTVEPALDRLEGHGLDAVAVAFTPPVPDPPKIWCIGLNYVEHASDLDEQTPEEPASFMRPVRSMVGPGEAISLPTASARVTGEAELAVVIGKQCRDLWRDEVPSVIAGFVPAIDMTAEDILRRNPRFLTRAKSFDTFLSLGPYLVTPDEIGGENGLRRLRVSTVLNGERRRSNLVANMRHQIYDLIAFHSQGTTWEAGDILLTGTPGAVVVRPGDIIGCEIEGVAVLENPVRSATPAD